MLILKLLLDQDPGPGLQIQNRKMENFIVNIQEKCYITAHMPSSSRKSML